MGRVAHDGSEPFDERVLRARSFHRECHMSEAAVKEPLTLRLVDSECPITVREAAKFLGVSPQTVYLWVERKQIPHLRVMGRNIRFLKSDLETFRASFRQEMQDA
jgi:excisionase family DNA binding protein